MSSTEQEPQITVKQTEVSISTTEVTGPESEVEAISAELAADISKISQSAVKSLEGFRAFILRGNVIDLAIGIVIGAAFTAVVTAVVGDIITPLIPVPGHSLSGLTWHPPYAGNDALTGKPIVVNFGALINALISFMIVAATLYFFVVQPVNALMKTYHKPDAPATPEMRECPYCFQSVVTKAVRCPYCTSYLPQGTEPIDTTRREDVVKGLMLPESLESLSEQLADKIVKKTRVETVTTAGTATTPAASAEGSTTAE